MLRWLTCSPPPLPSRTFWIAKPGVCTAKRPRFLFPPACRVRARFHPRCPRNALRDRRPPADLRMPTPSNAPPQRRGRDQESGEGARKVEGQAKGGGEPRARTTTAKQHPCRCFCGAPTRMREREGAGDTIPVGYHIAHTSDTSTPPPTSTKTHTQREVVRCTAKATQSTNT